MEVKLFWIIVINSLYVLTDEEFSIAPQILKNDLAIISLGLHISTYTILVSEALQLTVLYLHMLWFHLILIIVIRSSLTYQTKFSTAFNWFITGLFLSLREPHL